MWRWLGAECGVCGDVWGLNVECVEMVGAECGDCVEMVGAAC